MSRLEALDNIPVDDEVVVPVINNPCSIVGNNNNQELSAEIIWNKGSKILKSHLDEQIFSAWIEPLYIASLNVSKEHEKTVHGANALNEPSGNEPTGEVILAAPNKFCCEHVERNYATLISSTLNDLLGTSRTKLSFKVSKQTDANGQYINKQESGKIKSTKSIDNFRDSSAISSSISSVLSKVSAKENKKPKIPIATSAYKESNLNPKYNFSNYIVGSCNQFAHAVSLRVAENLGSNFNPLFLYGGVGLGKTHLANAIGNASCRRGKNVLLVSSELFVSELISSLRSNRMDQFKKKFRSLDLLIIDDIQFIIGKERTEEEFFHTFNELHHRHKQIIITSDRIPQELIGLEERLITRFSSGIAADLQAPDFETRVAILIKKAESNGASLSQDVARIIAEKIDTNVRELEGALNRLQAMSSLHKTPITASLAQEVVRNLVPSHYLEVTPELIQRLVTEKYHVSINDLLGKRRTQNIAFARQMAMYLCRRHTQRSYPEIGAIFGGRDHSTVIHAFKVIEERLANDQNLKSDVLNLEKSLTRGFS